jgi:hypothetical protein
MCAVGLGKLGPEDGGGRTGKATSWLFQSRLIPSAIGGFAGNLQISNKKFGVKFQINSKFVVRIGISHLMSSSHPDIWSARYDSLKARKVSLILIVYQTARFRLDDVSGVIVLGMSIRVVVCWLRMLMQSVWLWNQVMVFLVLGLVSSCILQLDMVV